MYFRIISLYLGCVFEFSLSNPTLSLRLVINCYNSNVSWCLRQNVLFIFSEVPLSTNRPSSTPLSAALYCFSTKNNEDPIKKKVWSLQWKPSVRCKNQIKWPFTPAFIDDFNGSRCCRRRYLTTRKSHYNYRWEGAAGGAKTSCPPPFFFFCTLLNYFFLTTITPLI